MSYKIAQGALSAAVAASGTFTVSYPSGTDSGTFQGAVGHKFVTEKNDVFSSPDNFTLSFGTSSITVTLGSAMSTLPAGLGFWLQLEAQGERDFKGEPVPAVDHVTPASLLLVNLGAPDILDADGVAASQTVTGAGTAFVINGALAAGGVATMDVPRNIVAAWTNTAILTVTGTDCDGNTVVEKSASGTSLTGKKAFKTVTSVTTSATVTSATVGTGDVLGIPVFVPQKSSVIAELQDGALLGVDKNKVYLTGRILDVGTASTIYFPSPVAGKITKVQSVLHAAISGADDVITGAINGTSITGLSITVANSGSAAGDVDVGVPTAANTVAIGDTISISNSGASTGVALGTIIVEITPTHTLNGAVVAGVDTTPSGTTGDVRGTYDPYAACDGALGFQLLVAVADPSYRGRDQYAG